MKDTLQPGLKFEYTYRVSQEKTVPFLFPDIEESQRMPKVFATGFLVGLYEFACIKAINPHLDWPAEQSVGIAIHVSHEAATPPGFSVTVRGVLEAVKGRKLTFSLSAHDGVDKISEGSHVRYIIDADAFNATVEKKTQNAASSAG